MVIKAQYHRALHRVMDSLGVQGLSASPISEISATAQLKEVVQYTEWHVGYRSRKEHLQGQFVNRHYRYERYRELLSRRPASARRQANIDIGCGAGVFSWAFLDWAHQRQVGYDRVDLYGFDHCRAMITLAGMLRDEMAREITDYPSLHYYSDIASLLRQLTNNHHPNTDYTITFGHVLVQANAPQNIRGFAEIVAHVANLIDDRSRCALAAVDARGNPTELANSWGSLLSNLEKEGVKSRQEAVSSHSAKFAWLSREN